MKWSIFTKTILIYIYIKQTVCVISNTISIIINNFMGIMICFHNVVTHFGGQCKNYKNKKMRYKKIK